MFVCVSVQFYMSK